ncbi:TPA: hypothetical protein ACH3X3_013469 [Trebouxia sp. C0006]
MPLSSAATSTGPGPSATSGRRPPSHTTHRGVERDDQRQPASACVVAIIENRAKEASTAALTTRPQWTATLQQANLLRLQVGMAAMDTDTMKLSLMQYVESTRTYNNTLSLLQMYEPSALIIVGTNQAVLSTRLNQATRAFHQVPLGRACFDDTKGAALLGQYAGEGTKVDLEGTALRSSYYLAFGAAGALLSYLEQEQHMFLAANCLDVDFAGTQNHMQIDLASVEALELIKPLAAGAASKKGTSLYRFLNYTKTVGGARLLRANLLQPLTSLDTLRMRQDAVQELVSNGDLAFTVGQGLSQMPKDLDRVCGTLAMRNANTKANSDAARRISSLVGSLILLKETLELLPGLGHPLEGADSELLQAIGTNCTHEVSQNLLETATEVLDEDVKSSKTSFINRTQQCFAVKSGVDGILDLARSTFCRVTEQVHELVDKYKTEYGLDALKVSYAARRGFYMVCPQPGAINKAGEANPALPRTFIQLDAKNRHNVDCTSHELNALNSRLKDATNDCMVLTEQVLDATVAVIAQHISHLHKLIDNIALLDMLCSLATVVSRNSEPYVIPQCTQTGPIAIVEGRHPIIETRDDMSFQSNDTYMAEASSFHIITGPNMAGKSTYLRQVALIVIMAQIGSFVPAKFASVRLVDKLFTRIGTSDSIESNSSSFMVEMQETAHIVNHATERSLVIVDELGRATSTADGIGIAWAVSEHLIGLGACTLFATHFSRLSELAAVYPNCKLWHFGVNASAQSERLDYTWKLQEGQQQAVHYGLILANSVGIPEEVAKEAKRVVARLDAAEQQSQRIHSADPARRKLADLYSLGHKASSMSSKQLGAARRLC